LLIKTTEDIGKQTVRDRHTRSSSEGYRPDGIGAPIFDHEGCVIAGISITTPAVRTSPTRREELIRQVVRAAQKLSEKLGYHTGRSPKD